MPKIIYPNLEIKLNEEEYLKVKDAINKGYDTTDLDRKNKRIKLNLKTFIELSNE